MRTKWLPIRCLYVAVFSNCRAFSCLTAHFKHFRQVPIRHLMATSPCKAVVTKTGERLLLDSMSLKPSVCFPSTLGDPAFSKIVSAAGCFNQHRECLQLGA
jgi:hypothetical protein